MIEDTEKTDEPSEDDGPRVHTRLDEGHPAGDGPRSDRDIGGPVAAEDAEPTEGSGTGTRPTDGLEAHE